MFKTIKEFFVNRMSALPVFAGVLVLALVVYHGDHIVSRLLQVSFMLVKMTLAGYLGYWLHKMAFRDFRPVALQSDEGSWYMFFRAIVVGAAIVASGMVV